MRQKQIKLIYLTEYYGNIGDLKKAYYKLAMQLHPDHGGSNESMKILNNEYELLVKSMETETSKKAYSNSSNKDIFRHSYYDYDTDFINMINELLKVKKQKPEIEIEICLFFIYVHNTKKEDKDIYNKNGLGLIWNGNKSAWYYKPAWYYKKGGGAWSMDKIRNVYGSETVTDMAASNMVAV